MGNQRRRMILGSGSSSRLPAAYQEVEYLESSGGQYINTGVKTTSAYSLRGRAYCIGNASRIYGVFSVRSPLTNYLTLCKETISGNLKLWYASSADVYTTTGMVGIDLPTTWFDFQTNGRSITVDGTTYTISSGSACTTQSYNLYLFMTNGAGTTPIWDDAQSKVRLAYFEIYDANGILVRDFIPCYRKADGVAGMYDVVGNQFYTNQGTGTFLVGADVGDDITRYGLMAEYLLQNDGNDTSGHGYNLTNQGGVTFDGDSAYFNANGTTSYLTINQTVIPTASSDVTISANVKCGSDASGSDYRNCIFQVHDSTYQSLQSGYEIGIKYGNARGYVQGSTTKGYEIASSKAVADDNWHNLVLTANATSKVVNLYVDGLLVGTTTASTFPSQNSKPLRIGNQWSGSSIRFWLGYMKNIRIYNRVLPDAELVKLANEIAGYGGVVLYDNGDEKTSVTGGWGNTVHYGTRNGTTVTNSSGTKSSNYMTVSLVGVSGTYLCNSLSTANKISLAGYTKLCLDVDITTKGEGKVCGTTTTTYNTGSGASNQPIFLFDMASYATGRQIVEIDISSYSDDAYIEIDKIVGWSSDAHGAMNIYKVWLE